MDEDEKTLPRIVLDDALESMALDPEKCVQTYDGNVSVDLDSREQVTMLFAEMALSASSLRAVSDTHAVLVRLVNMADDHRVAGPSNAVTAYFPGWTLAD